MERNKLPENKWHGRVLTSLLAMVGFLVSGLSGLILFFEPQGRVAYWTHWSFWGLSKTQWDDIHILSSIMFVAAGGFHIYFNWNPLVSYMTKKAAQSLRYKRELGLSLVVGLWLVVSGIFSLPPLSYVPQFGGFLKSSWVTSPDLEPPFGHAELLSLKVFCQRMGIPLDKAMAELKSKNMKIEGPGQSLEDMAVKNDLVPMQIYALIKQFEPKPPEVRSGATYTKEQVENMFAGSGLGRKKFKDLCQQLKLDPQMARQRLKTAGVTIEDEQSVKQAAEATGKTPLALVIIMLDAK